MIQPVEMLIPKGRRNRPGLSLSAEGLTIHSTGNRNATAGALAHAKYVLNDAAANVPVSWRETIGADGVYIHLPEDENGWHAGDGYHGPGNRTTLGLEICENVLVDGNIAPHVVDMGVERAAHYCRKYSWLPNEQYIRQGTVLADVIHPHRKWTNKNCPNLDIASFRLAVAHKMHQQLGQRIHVIRSGDTFWALAKQYGVTVADIQAMNPGVNPAALPIGGILIIPAAKDAEDDIQALKIEVARLSEDLKLERDKTTTLQAQLNHCHQARAVMAADLKDAAELAAKLAAIHSRYK